MSTHHEHADLEQGNEAVLKWALALTASFLVIEVIGSFMTGSLALLSDAAHMFTDTAALAIALVAIRIGQRPADVKRTYGYRRFEILAAAFNAVLLFLVALYIVYEAYQRLQQPPELQAGGMFVIALAGLAVNLISMRLLARSSKSSLNVKGAYLEVWSDMLGSLGVLIGAVLIGWLKWVWIDALIAVLIGLWVLPRTWTLLKESLNILLEGVPDNINPAVITQAMEATPGVVEIHDLHVWAITSNKVMLTSHLLLEPNANAEQVLKSIHLLLEEKFHIYHSTLQCEYASCNKAVTSVCS